MQRTMRKPLLLSDDLASALQALAGPAAGPNGGEVFVDGFSGARLPPKSSIREVRVNQNPFSAEFDRIGFGRIEILTKPGTNEFAGEALFNFNDESLNARNPYMLIRAPYQVRSLDSPNRHFITQKGHMILCNCINIS